MSVPDSMIAAYDRSNVFARILRGELPCRKVYEDEFVLAFHDIAPLAPVHVLVIPKGEYVSQADFGARAPAEMIVGFWRAVSKIARDLGLDPEGYRIVANHGPNGGQLVFHFHVHIFGGGIMGHSTGMPKPDKQA
ncbi:histidine triad nucleotide-binding protein [uncultured Reyranella sp.]|uniref:histidine triad nucleotide-binding protein n=1 Tax=uncultured Reyranella sp. TaxID=735512 RepID=UPI00259CA3FC|nr:histidine triad nucleotide-binding protein [uncultured Reyranella sp.]